MRPSIYSNHSVHLMHLFLGIIVHIGSIQPAFIFLAVWVVVLNLSIQIAMTLYFSNVLIVPNISTSLG